MFLRAISFHCKEVIHAVCIRDPGGSVLVRGSLDIIYIHEASHVSYVPRRTLIPLCSRRWTFSCCAPQGDSLRDIVYYFGISNALKTRFLFEPLVPSSPGLSSLLTLSVGSFVGSGKSLQVPRCSKPIFIAPFGTLDTIVRYDGKPIFIVHFITLDSIDQCL